MKLRQIAIALILLTFSQVVLAGVLPEDRTDLLYHRYEGGGVEIDGPSLLVRKKVGKSVSLVGNYYVDMVSSASIDVVTTASPYTEERTQWSLGMDYLRGNTTSSTNYTSSVESDFGGRSAWTTCAAIQRLAPIIRAVLKAISMRRHTALLSARTCLVT